MPAPPPAGLSSNRLPENLPHLAGEVLDAAEAVAELRCALGEVGSGSVDPELHLARI